MKKLYLALGSITLLLALFTFLMAIFEFAGKPYFLKRFDYPETKFEHNEDYDPSLQGLNSLKKLRTYCDSIFEARKNSSQYNQSEKEFAQIASEVVRKRFYHGLSSFGFGYNYIGYLANPSFLNMYLNAPVRSNDILKFPYGICSQQAIVMMDLLKDKGYPIRKVGFTRSDSNGHFCFEVFYRGSWHFYDTDLEPDANLLNSYDRPGIKFLVDHKDILRKAYWKESDEKVNTLFPTYFYGKVNEQLARKAGVYTTITKFLSYTIWIFFLVIFLGIRRRYVRLSYKSYVRNRGVSFSSLQAR